MTMTASAMAVPIAAAANHARRRPRTAGNRRRGRRTRKPSTDSTTVTAMTDAAESTPERGQHGALDEHRQ